jgi:hypothetical protein
MERRSSLKLLPRAALQLSPSIRAFHSASSQGGLRSEVKGPAYTLQPLKSEQQLALPILRKYNKAKELRQTKAPLERRQPNEQDTTRFAVLEGVHI